MSSIALLLSVVLVADTKSQNTSKTVDSREISTGWKIPDEGYCDQPYVVVLPSGNWLCVMTTGAKHEGQMGQHVVSTVSSDQGKTWSKLVDIEPADGPQASWAVPLLTPTGRVYVFYDYNGDKVETLNGKKIRADMLGWYVFKYSDDDGKTWSNKRYRLPMRVTQADRNNDWKGKTQIFWGICKPKIANDYVLMAFTKLGKYMLDQGEGFVYRSDNILTETDPEKIQWKLWPKGEKGIRNDKFGSVQEEHNVVWLKDDDWYGVYRTTKGFPCQTYSRDGGKTWSKPEPMMYTPKGQAFKNPRACPKLFRCQNGKFLFWFHHHSGKSYNDRNPAWIAGGVLKDGKLHWSQPEILLYDSNPKVRMSYPDLIEQAGQYWVTETQKSVARVHKIDKSLFEGLWNQADSKTIASEGLALNQACDQAPADQAVKLPTLDLSQGPGFSIDLWLNTLAKNQDAVLFDNRDEKGRGMSIRQTKAGAVQANFNDGQHQVHWKSADGRLKPNATQHVVIMADAGPKIIMGVIDGVLEDGGSAQQFGWVRWKKLGNVAGTKKTALAACLSRLRIYTRPLRVSEAVAHFHKGAH